MQRSNRTELCDATRNKKQSRFETHLGSDATVDLLYPRYQAFFFDIITASLRKVLYKNAVLEDTDEKFSSG